MRKIVEGKNSLTQLVYFVIAYPNGIYLAILKEFICKILVEIGKTIKIFLISFI